MMYPQILSPTDREPRIIFCGCFEFSFHYGCEFHSIILAPVSPKIYLFDFGGLGWLCLRSH